MSRGYCVDCHYNGPLTALGECSRCGSDWTTTDIDEASKDRRSNLNSDGLSDLLGRSSALDGRVRTDFYQF